MTSDELISDELRQAMLAMLANPRLRAETKVVALVLSLENLSWQDESRSVDLEHLAAATGLDLETVDVAIEELTSPGGPLVVTNSEP